MARFLTSIQELYPESADYMKDKVLPGAWCIRKFLVHHCDDPSSFISFLITHDKESLEDGNVDVSSDEAMEMNQAVYNEFTEKYQTIPE
ncbi:18346_t:CDS:2, partial [Racocetra persica]